MKKDSDFKFRKLECFSSFNKYQSNIRAHSIREIEEEKENTINFALDFIPAENLWIVMLLEILLNFYAIIIWVEVIK